MRLKHILEEVWTAIQKTNSDYDIIIKRFHLYYDMKLVTFGIDKDKNVICRKHGVEMFFKGGNTIKDLLVHPKDRDAILQNSRVIYRLRCGRVDCDEEYIGESGRTFAERFREQMKVPSPIHAHHNITDDELSLDNFSTVGREDQSIARTIKEAILIRVNDPSLNRNIAKYQLPHIWDEVLVK